MKKRNKNNNSGVRPKTKIIPSDNKNKFWEELAVVVGEAIGIMFVVGGLNSRVGIRDDEYISPLGTNGETEHGKHI